MMLETEGEQTVLDEDRTFNGVKVSKGIEPSKIIERSIYLYDEPDRTFERYGHLVYPIVTRDHHARLGLSSGYKQWEQENVFKKFLTDGQARSFYPHEEVTTQLQDIFEKDLKDSGMKIVKQYNSHATFSNYWECLSDRFDTDIKDSYRPGDVVQVGLVVRNGIGTAIALGIDLFTMALVCQNGAIARGKDLGTISITHASSYEKMRDRFIEDIPVAISAVQDLIAYYQRSVYVKMNQKIAEGLYEKLYISDKHFPSYFGIDQQEIKKLKEEKKEIEAKDIIHFNGDVSLWQTFNDFTADIWKSDRFHFSGKRAVEINLHNQLIQTVRAQ
jgi:hypothetical protein